MTVRVNVTLGGTLTDISIIPMSYLFPFIVETRLNKAKNIEENKHRTKLLGN